MSSKNSSKAKSARQEIRNELSSIEWTNYWKKTTGMKRWCKDCNDWTRAVFRNAELEPCCVCTEKKQNEEAELLLKIKRAEMYQKAMPVQSGISFVDMVKK